MAVTKLRLLVAWFGLFGALVSLGCARRAPDHAIDAVLELRREGPATTRADVAGRWLLSELISPGGAAEAARRARAKLDALGGGDMLAHLARGIDDSMHGRMRTASDHYLRAAQAARTSSDSRAPFVAWFTTRQALQLKNYAPGLWKRWKPFVEQAMREPRNLGWRARGELVEWWSDEAYAEAARDVDKLAIGHFGCLQELRLAGPFGRGAGRDSYRKFAAELPGPWPERWQPEAGIGEQPHILKSEQTGCVVSSDEPVSAGIFYAETFIELPEARQLILAVQGALAIWVDDRLVLERDPRKWGVWPRFGALLELTRGRHRILTRLADAVTSARVLYPDGRPMAVKSSRDASRPYVITEPLSVSDPNLLDRHIRQGRVDDSGDDVLRFIGAYLANIEGQGDVASVWIEPLLATPERTTGVTLTLAATFAENDPIFDRTQVRDLIKELHERALQKDPLLWQPKLSLALWEAERAGPSSAVRQVRTLTGEFPEVPAALLALSRLYGELGWSAEHAATVKELAARFPEDTEALQAAVEVYAAEGATATVDTLVLRIRKLDPDSEIVLTRAMAREDYPAALAELKRLANRRPDRKDLVERIHDVMVRAGNDTESWKKLEAAIQQNPRDERARLALADARFATGKRDALRKALLDAVEAGGSRDAIKDALDLVEGKSELEPYRIQAMPVIRAYEKSGKHMPGTAARLLDYAAVWVRSDGSSRMLEHEIVRIQSAEAISQLAEQRRLDGLVLHMRVIKKDGRVLEPEIVDKKPTVTFPHLEVGDYIETEHITSRAGDGRYGDSYVGPHWFFREENIAYARSEFVVISPKHKPLIIETRGNVPVPELHEHGLQSVRRWRVEFSPAAPIEPNSAPASEFLPSVRIGWGVSLESRVLALADTVADVTPVDPRIARIAQRIIERLPGRAKAERARRLYRWILSNVEDGEESDGRRVVVGKRGNRWRGFLTLCRAVGLRAEYAVARNRLASPARGPLSRASLFSEPLVRVDTERGPLWLTVSNKYAAFGYIPAEVRGMPAFLLSGTRPELVTTETGGAQDSIVYEGSGVLAPDGSARIELVQRFFGKYATSLRSGLAEVPGRQLHDLIESRLLARTLRGARLLSHRLEQLDDLDAPLTLRMTAEVPAFAQLTGTNLILSPPFVPKLSQLATLPSRQTPLLLADAMHQEVRFKIELPAGARINARLSSAQIKEGERAIKVSDSVKGTTLMLDRIVNLPAGRVQPADYARFVQFARGADDALSTNIRIALAR